MIFVWLIDAITVLIVSVIFRFIGVDFEDTDFCAPQNNFTTSYFSIDFLHCGGNLCIAVIDSHLLLRALPGRFLPKLGPFPRERPFLFPGTIKYRVILPSVTEPMGSVTKGIALILTL